LSGFLDLLRVRWDAPYRFVASVLALASAVGLFLRTGPLLTLSGAAGWTGVSVVQSALTAAHHWLNERGTFVAIAGLAIMLFGLATAYFQGRAASSTMIGIAASVEVGSWAPVVALGLVVALWISIRIYDLVSDDSESWRVLNGANRVVGSLWAASFYAIALPFSWAFIRG
jgi:hypothetical protein